MNLLLYKENQHISKAELTESNSVVPILEPDKILADLFAFDWRTFTYYYEALLSSFEKASADMLSANLYSQLSSLPGDTKIILQKLLFDPFDSARGEYVFPDRNDLPFGSFLPLCEELLDRMKVAAQLIETIASHIRAKKDSDYLEFILQFAYDYHLNPLLCYTKKMSVVQCFDILRDCFFIPENSAYEQFGAITNQLLASNNKNELIYCFSQLTDLIGRSNALYSLFYDYIFTDLPSSEEDVDLLLTGFVTYLDIFVSRSSDKHFKTKYASQLYLLLNSPPYPNIPETHTCDDLISFICCLTLSYYKQQTPLAICQCCHRVFVRSANSQKSCKSENCQKLAAYPGKVHSQKLFGRDLYNVLNNVYKRLCYSGTGKANKYDENRYCQEGISPAISKHIVTWFSQLKKTYVNELNKHISIIWELPEYARAEYMELVEEWIDQINSYYTQRNISNLISEAIHTDNSSTDKGGLLIKVFHLDSSCPKEIIVSNKGISLTEQRSNN